MAESASGQDEANPEFWFATGMSNIVQLGISRFVPARKSYLPNPSCDWLIMYATTLYEYNQCNMRNLTQSADFSQ